MSHGVSHLVGSHRGLQGRNLDRNVRGVGLHASSLLGDERAHTPIPPLRGVVGFMFLFFVRLVETLRNDTEQA